MEEWEERREAKLDEFLEEILYKYGLIGKTLRHEFKMCFYAGYSMAQQEDMKLYKKYNPKLKGK